MSLPAGNAHPSLPSQSVWRVHFPEVRSSDQMSRWSGPW